MVKFGQRLRESTVRGWEPFYVDYEHLKALIYRVEAARKKAKRRKSKLLSPGGMLLSSKKVALADASPVPEEGSATPVSVGSVGDGGESASVLSTPLLDGEEGSSPSAAEIDEQFEDALMTEAEKVDSFYVATLADYQQRLLHMIDQAKPLVAGAASAEALAAVSLQTAMADLYRKMQFLENFSILNYTGFVKVLKKHDKVLPGRSATNELLPLVRDMPFHDLKSLQAAMEQLTETYEAAFTDGDSNVARSQLQMRRHSLPTSEAFALGMRVGIVLVLLFWMIWDAVVDDSKSQNLWLTSVWPVYRGIAGFIVLLWCWGLQVYVWSSVRINFEYLFEFEHDTVQSPKDILREASSLTIIYIFNFLLYYKVIRGDFPDFVPAQYYPLALLLYMATRLVFPWEHRRLMFVLLASTVTAPFGAIRYVHSYVGDVMTSMVHPFKDIAYTICFFTTGDWMLPVAPTHAETHVCPTSPTLTNIFYPLLSVAPLWFRMHQNLRRYYDTHERFPHIFNALKYAAAHSVVLLGAFHPLKYNPSNPYSPINYLWMASLALSTLYTYSWDVKMDWDLAQCGGNVRHFFLREHLLYVKRVWFYYVAIFMDLVLRFFWTLSLIPNSVNGPFHKELGVYIGSVAGIVEIFRRSMWGCIRLENEHLSNVSGFRRVKLVPTAFTEPMATSPRPRRRRPSTLGKSKLAKSEEEKGTPSWTIEVDDKKRRPSHGEELLLPTVHDPSTALQAPSTEEVKRLKQESNSSQQKWNVVCEVLAMVSIVLGLALVSVLTRSRK
eukprot:PLAT7049.2.p1 GENE.PLAT7049.2~~PLAT7049.2.p1  ORF type:complete len:780 (-),score=368.98 PLAT7049.2:71-2410(-)